jgi:hypothetical protein
VNATARPDLSQRSLAERLRAAVAETQGWQVRITDADDEPDFEAGELVGLPPDWKEQDPFGVLLGDAETDGGPDSSDWTWIPRYDADPAAWGALVAKERVGVFPFAGRWRALAARGGGGMRTGLPRESVARDPGWAVCLAVLAKYQVDSAPYRQPDAA